jgi:hypothetical protein
MNFAGKDYAYISKGKIEKTNELRSKKYNNMTSIKEEKMGMDDSICDKFSEKKVESEKHRRRSRSRSKSLEKRRRSRSGSFELNEDDELDGVYSGEEEFEEELLEVKKEIQPIKQEEGIFSKIGNSIKGLFSKYDKKKKKQNLYSVSKLKKDMHVEENKVYKHEVDTNVLSIKFEFLQDKVAYALGDPVKCKCDAILNKGSQLERVNDSEKKIWICEFCGEKNEIFLEDAEIPKDDCIDYFVQNVNQLKGNKGYNYNDDQTLIFCFDISGSMCVSSPVQGKHQFKGNNLQKSFKDLMSFSDGSDQFFGGTNRNVTYISRLQCLQAAIESNLSNILKNAPNRKVGFVAFNNEVIGYGDGSKSPAKISGNNLNDYEAIKSFAEANQNIISSSLKDAHGNLLKQLYTIEETGQTALGPAVLFSINLFSGVSPGSRIILCTDGISNTGIGNMEDVSNPDQVQKLKDFYSILGLAAKDKGIVIDLITFEDEQSNIEILMTMVEQTGGEIIRVKPTEILEEFGNLLTNEVVATNVKVKVKLHKLMHFRNEESKNMKDNETTLVKEIGNATKESELFVEYCFKKSEEIASLDVDLEKLTHVPFQSIIDYTNKQGDQCIRVVTKHQKISTEKDFIQKEANFDIISTNAMQKTSKLAEEGDYRGAQSNALAWKKMIKSNAISSNSAYNNYKVFNNNMNSFNNNMQEVQYQNLNSMYSPPNNLNNNLQQKKANPISSIRSDNITQQIHSIKNISSTKSTYAYKKTKKKEEEDK